MLIIPAIDLRGGKCVRLYRGDFNRETVFSDDPVATAQGWVDQGATTLHVIDLDGAKQGVPQNLGTVQNIVHRTGARVHLGGGLRTRADVERAFDAGAVKVNVGTALLGDPGLLYWLVEEHREHVLAALDCRDGMVLARAWQHDTGVPLIEAANRLIAAGLTEFVYTDVFRDGTLSGPDLQGISRLLDVGAKVIASGGVSRLEDVAALTALEGRGLQAIIIGRALYAGALTLAG
ncbi:MAG: HisA/HisF-related TIM barrel protein, partial [Bacillota bacterium]